MRQGPEACKGIYEIPGTRPTDVRRAWYTGTKAGRATHPANQSVEPLRRLSGPSVPLPYK